MSWLQVLRNFVDRRHNIREVGVFGLAERHRHADIHGVDPGELGEIGRCGQAPPARDGSDHLGGNIGDVGLAASNLIGLPAVDVKAEGGYPCLGKFDGQGKADVTEANDPHVDFSRPNLVQQRARHHG